MNRAAPTGAGLLALTAALFAGLGEVSDLGLQAALFTAAWMLTGMSAAVLLIWIGVEIHRNRNKGDADG